MSVPVLIVAYKNPAAAARAVNSVARCMYSTGTDCWPVFRDNSNDNIGFTKAVNELLQLLPKVITYAIILSQDAGLLDATIERATQFMEAHPRCAIAGFKQLDPLDPDIITHGGTGACYPAGVHLTGRLTKGDHAVSRTMTWVNGAAMIVRLDAIKEIGLMDERFFNWCSDSDWCLTAWRKGWEVWYCAEAVCLHAPGASANPTDEQREQMAKDHAAFAEKWSDLLNPAQPTHANNEMETTA